MSKAFEIKKNEKVGRHVVTARSLKAGEEVLTEWPWAVGPKSGSPPMCLGCHAPVDCSTLCSVCGWPVCGPECELLPIHKDNECAVFAAAGQRYQPETEDQLINGSPQFECITPLRVLLNKEKDVARWETEIKDMEAHCEARRQTPDWETEHINVVEFLRTKCKLADRFSEDLIHWAIGVLEVNAFEVCTEEGYFVRGLYPQSGLMSHNCVANTTHTIYPRDNFKSHVRVTVDVPEGGELFVSYTSSIQPTILRRENLKYSKYFDCDCKRCSDPTELGTHLSTLKCTKCDNGVIMSSNPLDQEAVWNCTRCEFSIRPETLRKVFRVIQSEIEQIDLLEDPDRKLEESERLMKKFKSVLHPRNVYLTSLRHSLLQLYGRAPSYTFQDLPDILLEHKIEMCRSVLEVADVVKPGMNRFRGMVLYELHVPLMLLSRSRYTLKVMTEEEYKKKMEEVAEVLQEAVDILCLEDPTTQEGSVGLVGKESLQELRASIAQL